MQKCRGFLYICSVVTKCRLFIHLLKHKIMKSTIRIEFNFDTNQPVLRIKRDKESDDLRDQMLSAFIEKANYTESHLYITYPKGNEDNSVLDIRCETVPPQKIDIDDYIDEMKRFVLNYCQSATDMKLSQDFFEGFRTKTKISR